MLINMCVRGYECPIQKGKSNEVESQLDLHTENNFQNDSIT